jgi:hypothetical protein
MVMVMVGAIMADMVIITDGVEAEAITTDGGIIAIGDVSAEPSPPRRRLFLPPGTRPPGTSNKKPPKEAAFRSKLLPSTYARRNRAPPLRR